MTAARATNTVPVQVPAIDPAAVDCAAVGGAVASLAAGLVIPQVPESEQDLVAGGWAYTTFLEARVNDPGCEFDGRAA